ncbi:hypothetical protein BOX15_Mlig014144g2 [Macrostomum lignano]|uniref:Uncharacterized protein n=1 Tax=Macrostomum lignano TaxID=282301 RepID=A0A267F5S5_9PLAT|nr:hypothetical protein BOX15_Mlig014144g2 [Macrostomum lignano]
MYKLCRPRRAFLLSSCIWAFIIFIVVRFVSFLPLRQPDSPPPLFHRLSPPAGNFSTGFSGPLVRIVHQSWASRKLPEQFAEWSRSFSACFPDFRRRLWTDEDNRELIARHYPWFLRRYDSLAPGVQRADVSRLFYMYHYGGLYCDLDCECLRDFRHLLDNASLVFGAMQGLMIRSPRDPAYVAEGQIENSFMYSRPRHPFFWDLIVYLNATTGEMPIMSSGPYLIMSGIHAARQLGIAPSGIRVDGRDFLTVYPPAYFNPYSWMLLNSRHCRLYGRFENRTQLRQCRDSFQDSYVMQYHTQVWAKGSYLISGP